MEVRALDRPEKTALVLAHRIVRDIRNNGHLTGHRLPSERVMVEEYQVGRNTLKEALRYLEFQGVLTLRPGPGGGPVVGRPDATNVASSLLLVMQFHEVPFQAIVEARQGLEPLMARLATERIDPQNLGKLGNTLEVMQTRIDDDLDGFLEANKQFHDLIASASGNALFQMLVEALLGILDGSVVGVDYPPHRRKAILQAHTRIYEALERGDVEATGAAMEAHMTEYSNYIARKFPQALAEPVTWDLG